jgi:hypothetical protein
MFISKPVEICPLAICPHIDNQIYPVVYRLRTVFGSPISLFRWGPVLSCQLVLLLGETEGLVYCHNQDDITP